MSKTRPFIIHGEYIELIQLLKVLSYAESGGHAKALVEQGLVKLNGQIELRKRAKLRPGDQVEYRSNLIQMQAESSKA